MQEYMYWIGSCGKIVSTDSLGLHIALAMEKPLVGLFGPTPSSEVHANNNTCYIQVQKTDEIEPETVAQMVVGFEED